ncbi:MAG: nitroreductase family protein [Bacteroidia bacterium]
MQIDFLMQEFPFIPYKPKVVEANEMLKRSESFYKQMDTRRSVRHFSNKAVDRKVIENIIKTASTAPSGAHKQPWTFALVANGSIKKQIRKAAEEEEQLNYNSRMSDEWLRDLAPLGTDEHKPFLEIAPWLIVVFKKSFDLVESEKRKNYYVSESVGLASGFLLTAIHNAGLVSLTHTPSPMGFLDKILQRPANEKAFLLIPVGYAAQNAQVPDIDRKPIEDVSVWYE